MNKQQAIQYMHEDLNKMPDVLKVCAAILNYVCSQPEQTLKYITFATLMRVAGLKHKIDVIPASQYLIGARVPLLVPKFEFIEDDYIEEISLDEVAQARKEGVFYHPYKGEPVADFESKIFMYFSLSPDGRKLLHEQQIIA